MEWKEGNMDIYKSIINGLEEAIEYERQQKLNTHVYCIDCAYINHILECIKDMTNEGPCKDQCPCFPCNCMDFEDSKPFKIRLNYRKVD